jgi:thermitase
MRLQLKRSLLTCLNLAVIGLSISLAAGSASATEYVIKLRDFDSLYQKSTHILNSMNIKVTDSHPQGGIIKIETNPLNQKSEAQILSDIRALAEVEYVVPNVKFHAFDMPNDPQISQQWSVEKVNAVGAWQTTKGSDEVVVAVIDTGIDWQHEDLKSQIWINKGEVAGNGKDDDGNGFVDDVVGWDFHGNDNDPMDETSSRNPGHGTHCAGIVGATGNNSVGISGMSQVVTLMPVRFLGADGSGDLMAGAKAIDYAVNNGAHIISASWGAAVSESAVGPIIEAIQRAKEKNVIFVAAAANDGKNNDTRGVFPANANVDNVISVAASGPSDEKPNWSNFGKAKVHVASPGLDIFSTLPKDTYGKLSGTSMATPLVAGLVGLMKAQADAQGLTLTPAQARSILQTTGAKVAIETACDCRVDSAQAVNAVRDLALTVVPAAATIAKEATLNFSGFGGTGPYTFVSANPNIATITPEGTLTAIEEGVTQITMTDASGNEAVSKNIYVGLTAGGGNECPYQDPLTCLLMCVINPKEPWCE